MPYEDDLPNIFANLASLVVSGNGTPQALATIYTTGNLPQEESSGPTLADLEEQFQREQRDTYSKILLSTGDHKQAELIAGAQSQEAINAAVSQTMVNILAKEENKVSLAADAVMNYEGPLDPDMNVADIVAPIYNVSPTKVEAVLKDRGKLAESYAKPFYDMDIGQDIIVQPEIIDITKPGPMPAEDGYNELIDMYQGINQPPRTIQGIREADPVGVISDDPEAEEERAINDAVVDRLLTELQGEFQNVQGDPPEGMDNAYFLGRINEIMNTTEGQGSGFAGRSAEDLLASWGENLPTTALLDSLRMPPTPLRFMKRDSEAVGGWAPARDQLKGISVETTPTVTDPAQEEVMLGVGTTPTVTAQEEVMLGPFRPLRELATIVEGAEAAPILTKMLNSQDRTYDYFVSPEGLGLWVDQEKNLWGAQEGPGGIDQLISYGQMAKGSTWNNETEYTLGGHTWLHNPDNAAMPWRIKDEQPVTTMAGGAALPLRSTLRSMTPPKQWETLRAQEMGENIWNPVQWGTRMQGFQPAYGQWLISGQQHTTPFHEFVQSGAQPDMAQAWQELARASAGLTSPRNITNPDKLALGRQVAYQGLLQADAARTNAVLMASAAMGAGEGYGADAMRAQLGSMYDVFAAEAAAAGQPVGGFIDWLNQRIVDMPGSVAPAGAGGQGG